MPSSAASLLWSAISLRFQIRYPLLERGDHICGLCRPYLEVIRWSLKLTR